MDSGALGLIVRTRTYAAMFRLHDFPDLATTNANADGRVRRWRKRFIFAGLVVAAGLIVSSALHYLTQPDASYNAGAERDCSARYAALLDLAELARRDGKSSDVVMRGLSDQRGAMTGCLPAHATR